MARSKRINLLASLTKGYDTVLDIGTDHGLVLKKAFDLGYIKNAIAADINPKPLDQAKENLKNYPASFMLSDGFKKIDQPFDLAIIAGMGSFTICDIMSDAHDDSATYVLQPNDKHQVLRTFLATNGYKITNEHIVHDGFYYIIIEAQKGEMALSRRDAYLGPILKTKKAAKPYYKLQLKTLLEILNSADSEKKKLVQTKIDDLKSVL